MKLFVINGIQSRPFIVPRRQLAISGAGAIGAQRHTQGGVGFKTPPLA